MACDHLYCKWHRSGDKSALKLLTLSSITYSTGTGVYKDMLSVISLVSIYIKCTVTCKFKYVCVGASTCTYAYVWKKKKTFRNHESLFIKDEQEASPVNIVI